MDDEPDGGWREGDDEEWEFVSFYFKNIFKNFSIRIQAWKENMYKRGFENPRIDVDGGAVFRYRTALQQRVARKKRLQIQYENHFIRLRALSKVFRLFKKNF